MARSSPPSAHGVRGHQSPRKEVTVPVEYGPKSPKIMRKKWGKNIFCGVFLGDSMVFQHRYGKWSVYKWMMIYLLKMMMFFSNPWVTRASTLPFTKAHPLAHFARAVGHPWRHEKGIPDGRWHDKPWNSQDFCGKFAKSTRSLTNG